MEYRLKHAKEKMPDIECIDFSKRSAEEQIKEKVPYGALHQTAVSFVAVACNGRER